MTNLHKFPNTQQILIYITSPLIPKITKTINNINKHHQFLFIKKNYFYHKNYILKYPNLHKSLIITKQPIPQNNKYKTYLKKFNPTSIKLPTNLLYFIQKNLNYYYKFNFKKKFPQKYNHKLLHKFPKHLNK